jgi:hypothetical protein
MRPTPFDPQNDLPPMPFEERHCLLAGRLKEAGLPWRPHVGCFVWDRDGHIEVSSPFPSQIYFILNLGHFLRRFENTDNIVRQLVWLPTEHQARLLAVRLGVDCEKLAKRITDATDGSPGGLLILLYQALLDRLNSRNDGHIQDEPEG